jgi:hypothetical protein
MKRDRRGLMGYFKAIDFDLIEFLPKWFNTLFAGSLEAPFVTRILAAYLSEGIKVVFRVAYVLFHEIEHSISGATNTAEIERMIR